MSTLNGQIKLQIAQTHEIISLFTCVRYAWRDIADSCENSHSHYSWLLSYHVEIQAKNIHSIYTILPNQSILCTYTIKTLESFFQRNTGMFFPKKCWNIFSKEILEYFFNLPLQSVHPLLSQHSL